MDDGKYGGKFDHTCESEWVSLEERLEVEKSKEPWFCPLIKGECNHDCYFYIKLRIVVTTVGIRRTTPVECIEQAKCALGELCTI